MALKLEPDQICQFRHGCQYAENCKGTMRRPYPFVCDYVDDHGNIQEGKVRLKEDITGRMKIIMESE